jgi:hypothetical protein
MIMIIHFNTWCRPIVFGKLVKESSFVTPWPPPVSTCILCARRLPSYSIMHKNELPSRTFRSLWRYQPKVYRSTSFLFNDIYCTFSYAYPFILLKIHSTYYRIAKPSLTVQFAKDCSLLHTNPLLSYQSCQPRPKLVLLLPYLMLRMFSLEI